MAAKNRTMTSNTASTAAASLMSCKKALATLVALAADHAALVAASVAG